MKERGTVAFPRPARASHPIFNMAATTNGAATPPAALDTNSTHATDSAEKKRKRDDDVSPDQTATGNAQAQRDILDILRQ